MAQNKFGRNVTFPIYNADGTSFHGLELKRATVDSVVMSLGDKITGEVFYKDNTLEVTMHEYVVFKRNPEDANEDEIKYLLVNPPTIVREGLASDNSELKGMTKYAFEFYHPMYILNNIPFSDVAVTNDEEAYLSQNKKFTWVGYPDEYIAKLNKNLVGTQWLVVKSDRFPVAKDTILSGVLSFEKNTIADALKRGYEVWDVPYVIDVVKTNESQYSQGKRFKVIFGLPSTEIYASAADASTNNPFVFRMGQGVGLKNNSRTPRNNKVITRISGYGSEDNIPYGYPQIVWTGDQSWNFTINNASGMQTVSVGGTQVQGMSYPIYDGIVGGQRVRLIKHPFTRSHLMPSIYTETVDKKVNPRNANYNPFIEIKDYYDAISSQQYPYVNEIDVTAPSYDIHEFDVKPEMNNGSGSIEIQGAVPLNNDTTTASAWDDTVDDDGNFVQSYFRIDLPLLSFDLYACASITQQMEINMRSGACLGCTFPIQVDWDEYKRNFYLADGTFDPVIHSVDGDGHVRDASRFPDTRTTRVSVIVQKENQTFGTIMPNIYQHPSSGDKFVVLGISLPLEYISSAEEKLDEQMKSYMLENNLYYYEYPLKFDDYFLAQNTNILAQLKPNAIVRFAFGGLQEPLELYVKQLTIKYGYSVLPQYEITLTDNIEVVLNQIGQVADDVEKLSSLISVFRESYSRNVWLELSKKLSKVGEDTAQGNITFLQGLKAGQNGAWGWIKESAEHGFDTLTGGVAWFNNLLSSFFETAIAKVTNYLTGGDGGLVIKGNVGIQPTTTDGNDGNLYVHDDITAGGDINAPYGTLTANNAEIINMLTTKNLTVTGLAHFFELVIDKIKAMGGSIIVTPVDGFKVDKVVAVTGGYNLYWTADDGEKGRYSGWKEGDQAICQTFNKATEIGVVNYDVSNTYYWSLVTYATDTPVDVVVDGETKKMHYITISNSVYDGAGQSAMQTPQVGDEIVMLGHRKQQTETDDEAKVRQAAIYIAAYNSIDRGDPQNSVLPLVAPLFAFYKGIDDFNLGSHRGTYMDANGSKFVGKFVSSTTNQDIESLLTGNEFNIIYGDGNPNVTQPHLAWTATEKLAHVGWLYFDLNLEPAIENGGRLWRWSQVEAGTGDDTDNDGYCWVCVTDIDTLAALDKIADVASDGKLTGGAEKVRVYLQWYEAKKTFDSLWEQSREKNTKGDWTNSNSSPMYKFTQVTSPTGNPSTNKYYELSNGKYVFSTDTTVTSGKTYYVGSSYFDARNAFNTAFYALSTYLNNKADWATGVPVWIAPANLNTTTILPAWLDTETPSGKASWTTGPLAYRGVWDDYYETVAEMLRALNAYQYKTIEEMGDDGLLDPEEKSSLRQLFSAEIQRYFRMLDDFTALGGTSAHYDATHTLSNIVEIPLCVIGTFMDGEGDIEYDEVSSPESNPQNSLYFELVDGKYKSTTDTSVVTGKTYYIPSMDLGTLTWQVNDKMRDGLTEEHDTSIVANQRSGYPSWLLKANETISQSVSDDLWDFFWNQYWSMANTMEQRIALAKQYQIDNLDVDLPERYETDKSTAAKESNPDMPPTAADLTRIGRYPKEGDTWIEKVRLRNPAISDPQNANYYKTADNEGKPLYNVYVCHTGYSSAQPYSDRFSYWRLISKPTYAYLDNDGSSIKSAVFNDTNFTSIIQDVLSITSRVNALQYGNLIINGDFSKLTNGTALANFSNSANTTLSRNTTASYIHTGFTYSAHLLISTAGNGRGLLIPYTKQPYLLMKSGTSYTLSVYAMTTVSSSTANCVLCVYRNGSKVADMTSVSGASQTLDGTFKRFKYTFSGDDNEYSLALVPQGNTGGNVAGDFYFCGLKLEEGSSATEWCPFDPTYGTVLESLIKQNADSIELCVTKEGAKAAGIEITYNAVENDGNVKLYGNKVTIQGDLDLSAMNGLGEVKINGDKLTIENDLDIRGLTTENVTIVERNHGMPTIINMGIVDEENDGTNPTKIKSVQVKAANETYTYGGNVDRSHMVVLPFYDSIVGQTGQWSSYIDFTVDIPTSSPLYRSFYLYSDNDVNASKRRVVAWKENGTRLTITNEVDLYCMNWEKLPIDYTGQSLYDYSKFLLTRAVVVCADARIICEDNLKFRSSQAESPFIGTYSADGNPNRIIASDAANSERMRAGYFSCRGYKARFIILLPGQSLQLRSQIIRDSSRELLVWVVENASDFEMVVHQPSSSKWFGIELKKTSDDDNYAILLLPGDVAFNPTDSHSSRTDCVFGTLAANKTGTTPSIKFGIGT